ncbi:hypothetical protein [uncultured Psychroserpens sp.]|uniref:hypothetical protein n=1 Tax=uncultured Psychroserpens sp. TaxID=255436 RepID=UPI0026204CA2|nr:hypothetical protein [uncultured Psychroserpens sp.]
MKKKALLIVLLISFSTHTFSQQKKYLKPFKNDDGVLSLNTDDGNDTLKKTEIDLGTINEAVSFGLSLGFNNSLETLYLAQISPVNRTLILSDAQNTSFVLSSVVSVPVTFKRKVYRFTNKDGDEIGELHKISGLSFIGIVNLATFNESQNGSIFNQKISGGLGISYNFNEHVAIGLSYELLSYRKPKDFLRALSGQEVLENGEAIESIDISDNNYFFDRYANTFSLKIIYKLTTK